MNSLKATATLFLDTRKAKKDGRFPVKLTIYCKDQKKRYSTGIDLTAAEWEKMNGERLRDDNLKGIKIRLEAMRGDAQTAIENIQHFTFYQFEEQFFKINKTDTDLSLQFWFKEYITDLKNEGRIGTAISYNTTINSLNDFKKGLRLQDITASFLKAYEAHMLKGGKSISTVGIYLRQLRSIINKAIKAKVINQESYPFKEYTIPSGRNVKKAIPEPNLKKLLDYVPTDKRQEKALDFWILSYLCSGINFSDILHLKHSNVDGNILNFIRQKTKNTKKKDLRPIKVGLSQRAIDIIEKWKNHDPENPYLFPLLEQNLSPLTIKHRCQRFIRWTNKYMDEIRRDLGITNKICTYSARHSFATLLLRKGAPIQFIKESLGHSHVGITENYLDSFSDTTKLEYAHLLTIL